MGIDWEGMLGVDGEDLQDAYDASIPDTEWDDDDYIDIHGEFRDITKFFSIEHPGEVVLLDLWVSDGANRNQLLNSGLRVDKCNHWYYLAENPVDKSVYERYERHYFQIAEMHKPLMTQKGIRQSTDFNHKYEENWYFYLGVLPDWLNKYIIVHTEILFGNAVSFGESLGFLCLYGDVYGLTGSCDVDSILAELNARFPSSLPGLHGNLENVKVVLDKKTIDQMNYMMEHWYDPSIFKEYDVDNPFGSKDRVFNSVDVNQFMVDNFSGLLMHIVSKFYEKFVRGDCDRCSIIAVDSPLSSAIFYSLDGFSKVAVDKLRNLGCEVSVYTTSWFDDDYDEQLLLVRHVMEHCGIWTEAMDEECAKRVGHNVCCLPCSDAQGVLYDDDSLVCQGLCNADLVPNSRGWDDVIIPWIFRGCVYVDDAEFEGFQVEIDCRGHVVRKDDIITILREYGGDTIGDDVYLSETPYTFHEPCNDYDYCDY